MTAIVAHQIRETLARPAPGQVLPGEFFLQDGTPALIWPLLPTDAETLRDVFRRLSPESRQHRFLQALDQLDDPMIRRLVDSVDGVHHIALLLIVLPSGGEEEPVGVARLLQYSDDPTIAEIAVTVVDDWQGRGVGTALVSALMQRRPAAVTRLRTLVAADNRASLALLAGAGRVSSGPPERGVLDVTVELPAATRARSVVEKAADLWLEGARKFMDQTYTIIMISFLARPFRREEFPAGSLAMYDRWEVLGYGLVHGEARGGDRRRLGYGPRAGPPAGGAGVFGRGL